MQYNISVEEIEHVAYEADLDPDYDIRVRTYSGRGMYGKECLGIECTLGTLLKLAAQLVLYSPDTVGEWIGNVSQDAMGMGTIYYWPSVQVVEVA